MKNFLIVLCVSILVLSCGKNKDSQSSEPAKQAEAPSSSSLSQDNAGSSLSQDNVNRGVSSKDVAKQTSTKLSQSETWQIGKRNSVLGVVTDIDRTQCDENSMDMSYAICGYPELKKATEDKASALYKTVIRYVCTGYYNNVVVTQYNYYGAKPDNALVCEMWQTSSEEDFIIAYFKGDNHCTEVVTALNCQEQ